ncbi:MAG: endo-1,4-beta-xylanase [Paludibacter sp.]|jgi:endo-1,4-beta-xylanase|nr:endo-1,4-beta-xylanase [Paludibacter sp.]
MKTKNLFTICLLSFVFCLVSCTNKSPQTLKDAYSQKFLIGVAVNTDISSEKDTLSVAVVKQNFNSIVAENCMKSMFLQPEENNFFWNDADAFVNFGQENNMTIIGHCLVWHSQAPRWFFVDENGADVSREVLIERMKNHITAVMTRYKGKIRGYDVVNEAVNDDGTLRNSKFLQIIGEDYLPLAYKFAHEADPDAELYYNDYSTAIPAKRDGIVRLVKAVQDAGIKVTAVGMQSHVGIDYPELAEYEKSIQAFIALGCNVNFTELDVNVLPQPNNNIGADVSAQFDFTEFSKTMNPYTEALPDSVYQKFEQRYLDLFGLYLKYADHIDRVTLWGVADGDSWLNNFPVPMRTNYPLLFDRNYQAKPIVEKLIKLAK